MSQCKCDKCEQLKAAIAAFRDKSKDGSLQWKKTNNGFLYVPFKKRRSRSD